MKSESEGSIDQERIRSRHVTVEPVVVFYFIAFYASQPLMQQYIYSRLSEGSASSVDALATSKSMCELGNVIRGPIYERQQETQAHTAVYAMLLVITVAIPAFFTTILLGAYSDKAGRKPAMIPGILGITFRMGVCSIVTFFELPLYILLPAYFIDGLLASAGGILMSTFAYLADITTQQNRPFRIMVLEFAMGIGITVAQISTGHLIASFGYFIPFFMFFCLSIINVIYVVLFLPETRTRQHQVHLFTLEHFRKSWSIYFEGDHVSSQPKRCWKLRFSIIIFAIFTAVDFGGNEVVTLYLLNAPLCWDSIFIGYYQGIAHFIKISGSLVLVKILHPKLDVVYLIILGLVSFIGYQIMLSQAVTSVLAFMAPVIGFGAQLTAPMLRAFSSKLVEPHEQGVLFGSQGLVQILGAVVGSITFNMIYSNTLYVTHGFVFMIAAAILFITLIFTIILVFLLKRERLQLNNYGLPDMEKVVVANKTKTEQQPVSSASQLKSTEKSPLLDSG